MVTLNVLATVDIWVMMAGLFVAAAVQGPSAPARSGPVGLVFPIAGAPLSAEQVEERTRTLPDGISTTETVRSQIYRDGAGRMRIESSVRGASGESSPFVYLLDPVAHCAVILLVQTKVAERVPVPGSGSGNFAVFLPTVGEALSGAEWKRKTEGLGRRMIGDIEVQGTRTTQSRDDQPSLVAVKEEWFSEVLALRVVIEASGPNWRHTAMLQRIDRRESDPALFTIPPDYTVRERD